MRDSKWLGMWYRWLDYLDFRSVPVLYLGLSIAAILTVFYYAGNGIDSLAPYAFALGKLALAAVAWELFDRLRYRDIDFIYEIKNGNIAAAVLAMAIAILLHTVFGNI